MSKLQIADKEYDLRFVKQIDEDNSDGECDYSKRSLKVKHSLKGESRKIAIIHEVLHAYFEEYGHRQWLSPELEECLCETIPRVLLGNFNVTLKRSTP